MESDAGFLETATVGFVHDSEAGGAVSSAAASLHTALAFWTAFDLELLRGSLDRDGLTIAENQARHSPSLAFFRAPACEACSLFLPPGEA